MNRLALASLAAAAVLVGCGDDDVPSQMENQGRPAAAQRSSDAPSPARPSTKRGTELVLDDSEFGPILFDSERQAIYLFDSETTSTPRCYGACAEAWPPVYADGRPRAGSGVDGSLLGTTRRRDGRTQVTYDGHPLYYYAHEGPGQVLCHDVEEFGGLWLGVQRSGEPAPS